MTDLILLLVGCLVGGILGYRDYRKNEQRSRDHAATVARAMALPPVHAADPAPLMKIVDRYGHTVDLSAKVNDVSFDGKR